MKLDLVEIEWLDHKGSCEWIDLENLEESLKPSKVHSVGYLLKETKTSLYFCSDFHGEDTQVAGVTVLIKSAIISLNTLKTITIKEND